MASILKNAIVDPCANNGAVSDELERGSGLCGVSERISAGEGTGKIEGRGITGVHQDEGGAAVALSDAAFDAAADTDADGVACRDQLNTVAAVQVLMRDMFRDYSRLVRTSATAHHSPAVQKAVIYIEDHISSPLSLHLVAEQLSLSPAYLSALFKRKTNVKFTDYLNSLRIDAALRHIRNERMTVSELAEMCGFGDAYYFSRIFKKITGKTPTDYMKGV